MKKTFGLVSTAALLVAAGSANAQTAIRQFRGSDTLENFTKQLVIQCGNVGGGATYPALKGYPAINNASEFDYLGGGSGAGSAAMAGGLQDIAPMSRALNTAEACTAAVAAGPLGEDARAYTTTGSGGPLLGSEAQGWVVALDGLAIMTSRATGTRCDTNTADNYGASLAFNSSKTFAVGGGTYTISDWKDALRVLYAGADNQRSAALGGGSNQLPANRIDRCNSAIRRALVSDWDNIIQGTADCGAVTNSCQSDLGVNFGPLAAGAGTGGIRHALRRDDASGTTDTFLSLLGLGAIGGNLRLDTIGANEPFCNGKDTDDKDPIRVRGTAVGASPVAATSVNGGPDVPGANLNEEVLGPVLGNVAGQACSDSGLVNAITVPTLIGTNNGVASSANPGGSPGNRREPTQDELYPTLNCLPGVFELRRPPRPNAPEVARASCASTYGLPDCTTLPLGDTTTTCWDPRCPDGQPLQFQDCLTPVAVQSPTPGVLGGEAEGNAHCLNARLNTVGFAPVPSPGTKDGRVWNLFVRAAPGSGFTSQASPSPVLRNERGHDIQTAQFRMRARLKTQRSTVAATNEFAYENVAANPDQTCRELDSTRAIGCIATTGECLIGFAGREGIAGTVASPATALLVGNTQNTQGVPPSACGASGFPDVACPTVNPLEDAIRQPIGNTNRYALARKLYVNSIVGFNQIDAATDSRWSDVASATLLLTQAPGGDPRSYNEQSQLAKCLIAAKDSPTSAQGIAVLNSINTAGFVTQGQDPAVGPLVSCEDIDETQCFPALASPPVASCTTDLDCGPLTTPPNVACVILAPATTGTCRSVPAGVDLATTRTHDNCVPSPLAAPLF